MKSFLRFTPAWFALVTLLPAARAEYSIVSRFPIGGDTSGYDYVCVDSTARRIYVAHEKRFEVLDADTGKKLGEIGPVSRAHGIALAPEFGHGFVSSGIDDLIVMFDLKTQKELKRFKSSGSNPDAIEYDPESKKVYAANHGTTGDVTVIDPAAGDIVATVKLGGKKLEGIGFDGHGHAFVNDEEMSAIHVFDTQTLAKKATWSLAPGEGGTGLAVDAKNHRVMSACANFKVIVLDSDSGKVVATPAIGEDPDGLYYDAKSRRIFSPNADGTMTILQQETPDKYSVLQTVKTPIGSKTIGFDEKTGRAVSCVPKFGPKPKPVKGGPAPKAPILAGSFEVILVGEK